MKKKLVLIPCLKKTSVKLIQTRITDLIIGGMTCHVMGRNIGDGIDDGDFWDVQTRNFNDNDINLSFERNIGNVNFSS